MEPVGSRRLDLAQPCVERVPHPARHPGEANLYTFFDYRVPRSLERDLGWRIDHLLVTAPLAERSLGCRIDLEPRRAEKPSDHTILIGEFRR